MTGSAVIDGPASILALTAGWNRAGINKMHLNSCGMRSGIKDPLEANIRATAHRNFMDMFSALSGIGVSGYTSSFGGSNGGNFGYSSPFGQ